MKHPLYIISAVDDAMGIGKNGTLAWHFRSDMKHFQATTTQTKDPAKQNLLIMGKVTWESIPAAYRPFKNRKNAVLCFDPSYQAEGVPVFTTLKEALDSADESIETIFVIGGASVYAFAIQQPEVDGIYLTRIHHHYQCDTFFPPIPAAFGQPVTLGETEENGIRLEFQLYRRQG